MQSSVPISELLRRGEVSILIVEDDSFLRNILVEKFKSEGYSVEEASDGEEALLKVKKKPHIVLLDLMLPKKDGYSVLESMKNEAVPVVILTNLSKEEESEKALSMGAKAFLVKAEHTPEEIVSKVKEVLEKHYIGR